MSSQHEIGRVIAISGSQITCLSQDGVAVAEIGHLARIGAPGATVFGTVNSVRADPMNLDRLVTVIDALGEVVDGGAFQRGVSVYPRMGTGCHPARPEDYAVVYSKPAGAAVRIGALAQDPGRPAFVVTDDLLAKHFAVLGTTGSGKSCTLALILRALLTANPRGHVVVLDPHAEYAQAFPDMATVLDTGTLQLPLWMMDFEETIGLLVKGGTASEQESQIAILKECIVQAKRKYAGDGAETAWITVDTPVPYRPGDLIRIIDGAMGKLDKPDTTIPYQRLKLRLEALNADRRFGFMFGGVMVRDVLPEVVAGILSIPTAERPMTIIDLSGVPSEVTDIVVSMISRMVFDFALWSDRARMPPVLLVCEEAHRYVPADSRAGFGATRKALERIAKEGRKYGVSLALVTQRPSELSPSILSQCGTLFALRMSNERDQAFVSSSLPENAKGLLDVLPALRRQEAIVVGEGVSVPMRMRFDDLAPEHRPRSGSAEFSKAWQADAEGRAFVEDAVQRWRRQLRGAAAAEPPPPLDPAPRPAPGGNGGPAFKPKTVVI